MKKLKQYLNDEDFKNFNFDNIFNDNLTKNEKIKELKTHVLKLYNKSKIIKHNHLTHYKDNLILTYNNQWLFYIDRNNGYFDLNDKLWFFVSDVLNYILNNKKNIKFEKFINTQELIKTLYNDILIDKKLIPWVRKSIIT